MSIEKEIGVRVSKVSRNLDSTSDARDEASKVSSNRSEAFKAIYSRNCAFNRFCIRPPKPSQGIVTEFAGEPYDLKHMAGGSVLLNELHRKATRWDKIVDEIVRLEKKIFPKHESLARSFDDELKKKNSGLLYLEINGDVVGYVMYSCPSSLCAIITKLAVKENHRRQGHGEALLKASIEKCRSKGIHRVSLHVDPSRTSAMHLYKKLGFQIDTLVKGYYSSDRDAYRMYIDFDKD